MIRIAIQNKGRLSQESIQYLSQLGITLSRNDGELRITDTVRGVEVLYVRDDDIPLLVENGAVDFGIVGENVLQEQGSLVPVISRLAFGCCSLVLAVPETSDIASVADISGKRIATSYPRLLQEFLKRKGIYAAIIPLTGSVEIAPSVGIADMICDLTQSGNTLKKNNLRVIETIFSSQAVLIKNPATQSVLPLPLTPVCK